MSDVAPSPRQQQAARARRTFLDKFPTPEARSQYFRDLSQRSAERRLTLSGEEAEAVSYTHLTLPTKRIV